MSDSLKKALSAVVLIAACGAAGYAGGMIAGGKNKVAVVRVPAIVEKSEQIAALRAENARAAQELQTWLSAAEAKVSNEKSDKKKQELTAQYRAEFESKKAEFAAKTQQKLTEMDDEIMRVIIEQAQAQGYTQVMPKSSLLYGGEDITDSIIPFVK